MIRHNYKAKYTKNDPKQDIFCNKQHTSRVAVQFGLLSVGGLQEHRDFPLQPSDTLRSKFLLTQNHTVLLILFLGRPAALRSRCHCAFGADWIKIKHIKTSGSALLRRRRLHWGKLHGKRTSSKREEVRRWFRRQTRALGRPCCAEDPGELLCLCAFFSLTSLSNSSLSSYLSPSLFYDSLHLLSARVCYQGFRWIGISACATD